MLDTITSELKRLGLMSKLSSLRDLQILFMVTTPSNIPLWTIQSYSKSISNQSTTLSEFTPVLNGSFGSVYLVYREDGTQADYGFIKVSPGQSQALLQEGLVQSASWSILNAYGFEKAIPRVYNIVNHPSWGIGLCIQKIPGSAILSDFLQGNLLWKKPCAENDVIFLSILIQLATYLSILQKELGFHHGDLKSTNILLVRPTETFTKTIKIDTLSWTYTTSLEAILIDFGFASIGSSTTPMRNSRDIFFFIASLWNIPDFRKSVTPKLATKIVYWLHDGKKNWARWLECAYSENLKGMYLLTASENFNNIHCQPFSILKDIQSIYPQLISID